MKNSSLDIWASFRVLKIMKLNPFQYTYERGRQALNAYSQLVFPTGRLWTDTSIMIRTPFLRRQPNLDSREPSSSVLHLNIDMFAEDLMSSRFRSIKRLSQGISNGNRGRFRVQSRLATQSPRPEECSHPESKR